LATILVLLLMKAMSNSTITTLLVLVMLALWAIGLRSLLTLRPVEAQGPAMQSSKDNEELANLYHEDQGDRTPSNGKSIDWTVVGPRDKARLARVKELYMQNHLHTGADYYYAALILQHGDAPEDFLLAHELCIVAISKGNRNGRSLAAASEDRFLMNIGRPQRFGTQYRADPITAPFRLYRVDSGVTDELRRALDVPCLAEAKAREVEMNRK
jgi:hypothetical protein